MKLKLQISKATAAAIELSEHITTNDTWLWARNPANQGKLDQQLGALKAKFTPFLREYMTEDAAVVEKRYGQDFIAHGLADLQILKTDTDKLMAALIQLKKRHVV